MHGCSVAILVLNVLDDSVCQLKDKEGRSLDYSVTSGTVHPSLSLSPFLSLSLPLSLTHMRAHTLSIFLALFFCFLHLHTLTHTHICSALRSAVHSSVMSWYTAPSTGPMSTTSTGAQVSNIVCCFPKKTFTDTVTSDWDVPHHI